MRSAGCLGLMMMIIITTVLALGLRMPKCNDVLMPCVVEGAGLGLCAVLAADGSCWVRMKPLMKCFTRAMNIKSGKCKGVYETRCVPVSFPRATPWV